MTIHPLLLRIDVIAPNANEYATDGHEGQTKEKPSSKSFLRFCALVDLITITKANMRCIPPKNGQKTADVAFRKPHHLLKTFPSVSSKPARSNTLVGVNQRPN